MEQQKLRAIVVERFYQTLAENDVEITALPPKQLQALVDAMADSFFAVLMAVEDEDDAAQATQALPHAMRSSASDVHQAASGPRKQLVAEELLWRGRPYLTIGTRYELTNQRLRLIRGILSHQIEEIELVRIRDTKVKQHVGERMLNVGDIMIYSSDVTTPETTLHNVRNPVAVREQIRQATLQERARRGLYYREDIGGDGVAGEP
jgi:hypothetical protein